MKLFKNDVGRPSNETIKKRNIIKIIIVFLIILGVVVISILMKKDDKPKVKNDKTLITKKQIITNNIKTTIVEDKSENNADDLKKQSDNYSNNISDNSKSSTTKNNPGRLINFESENPMAVYVGSSIKKDVKFFNPEEFKFSYSSSNPDIVSVDSNGVMYGKKYSSAPVYIKTYEEYSGETYTDIVYTVLDPFFVGDSNFSIGKNHPNNCEDLNIAFHNLYTHQIYDDISSSDIHWNFTGDAVSNGMFTHVETANKRTSHICVNENYLEHSEVKVFIKLGNHPYEGSLNYQIELN